MTSCECPGLIEDTRQDEQRELPEIRRSHSSPRIQIQRTHQRHHHTTAASGSIRRQRSHTPKAAPLVFPTLNDPPKQPEIPPPQNYSSRSPVYSESDYSPQASNPPMSYVGHNVAPASAFPLVSSQPQFLPARSPISPSFPQGATVPTVPSSFSRFFVSAAPLFYFHTQPQFTASPTAMHPPPPPVSPIADPHYNSGVYIPSSVQQSSQYRTGMQELYVQPPQTVARPATFPSATDKVSSATSSPSVSSGRKNYGPAVERSEWVMWVGSVPKDAHEPELWRFFTQYSVNGVASIFFIPRSKCAFVNYETEDHLKIAVARFDGASLRPEDPRCSQFVCRIRDKSDYRRAGVGGQRSTGLHRKWVKEKMVKERASPKPSHAESDVVSEEQGDDHPLRPQIEWSDSGSSTNSTSSTSLQKNFPRRYFIMKSLTQESLEISVKTGVWATQKHNEEALDRAFRTSGSVYLFFSVNKSGEFFGYARMTGQTIGSREQNVPWPQENTSIATAQQSSHIPASGNHVDNLKDPSTSSQSRNAHSGPATVHASINLRDNPQPVFKFSFDQNLERQIREGCAKNELRGQQEQQHSVQASWGNNFPLEWVSTERLSFQRTRKLRNAWNQNKEVKVARDGTELDPETGEALLDAWQTMMKEDLVVHARARENIVPMHPRRRF